MSTADAVYGLGFPSTDKYPPCINPHCKSYGKSHPNCRCWGGKEPLFSDGGEIEGQHCEGEHMPDCEHYAGGSFADSVIAKRKVSK